MKSKKEKKKHQEAEKKKEKFRIERKSKTKEKCKRASFWLFCLDVNCEPLSDLCLSIARGHLDEA